jgi:hypothetical protein
MRKAIDGLGEGEKNKNNKKNKKDTKKTPSLPPSTVPDWKE